MGWTMSNLINVQLTKSQCRNVAEFIELNLIHHIQNDPDIDNVGWIKDMVDAMSILERAEQDE